MTPRAPRAESVQWPGDRRKCRRAETLAPHCGPKSIFTLYTTPIPPPPSFPVRCRKSFVRQSRLNRSLAGSISSNPRQQTSASLTTASIASVRSQRAAAWRIREPSQIPSRPVPRDPVPTVLCQTARAPARSVRSWKFFQCVLPDAAAQHCRCFDDCSRPAPTIPALREP